MSNRMSIPYKKSTNPFDTDDVSPINVSGIVHDTEPYSEPLLNNTTTYINDTQLDIIYTLSPQQLRETYSGIHKYVLLVCVCLFTFGSYFNYDLPGALQTQLSAQFGSWYDTSNTLILYSVYSVPNCVLALLGGYLIDQVTGIRAGSVLFCTLVTIGNALVAAGVAYKQFWLCVLGRVVFGLGSESLTVAQNTMTVRWFASSTLPLLFGIVIAMSRVGSAVAFSVTPLLVDHLNVVTTVCIASSICLISLAACATAAYCDKYMSTAIELQRADIISTLPQYAAESIERHDALTADQSTHSETTFAFTDILRFPSTAYLLFCVCALFYVPILTFSQIASEIIQSSGYDADTASLYVSIPNFVAIIAVPTFGKLVSQYGYALYAVLIAAAMTLGTQTAMLSINQGYLHLDNIVYVMIWQGLAYSLGGSCLWPILSYVIDSHQLGLAYGAQTSVQQIAQVVAPLILAQLPTFYADMLFLACASCATMMLTGILVWVDRSQGSKLNMSSTERSKVSTLNLSVAEEDMVDSSAYLDNQVDDHR